MDGIFTSLKFAIHYLQFLIPTQKITLSDNLGYAYSENLLFVIVDILFFRIFNSIGIYETVRF